MKFLKVFIIAFTMLGCSACCKKTAAQKDGQQNPAEKTQTTVVVTDSVLQDKYRFLVSFYSIGEGTEGEQMRKFEKFVSDYNQVNGKTIVYEKSYWGREGEVNYCMKLSELPGNEQVKFMDGVKDVLKSAKWVHYSENTVCGRKRR